MLVLVYCFFKRFNKTENKFVLGDVDIKFCVNEVAKVLSKPLSIEETREAMKVFLKFQQYLLFKNEEENREEEGEKKRRRIWKRRGQEKEKKGGEKSLSYY